MPVEMTSGEPPPDKIERGLCQRLFDDARKRGLRPPPERRPSLLQRLRTVALIIGFFAALVVAFYARMAIGLGPDSVILVGLVVLAVGVLCRISWDLVALVLAALAVLATVPTF